MITVTQNWFWVEEALPANEDDIFVSPQELMSSPVGDFVPYYNLGELQVANYRHGAFVDKQFKVIPNVKYWAKLLHPGQWRRSS